MIHHDYDSIYDHIARLELDVLVIYMVYITYSQHPSWRSTILRPPASPPPPSPPPPRRPPPRRPPPPPLPLFTMVCNMNRWLHENLPWLVIHRQNWWQICPAGIRSSGPASCSLLLGWGWTGEERMDLVDAGWFFLKTIDYRNSLQIWGTEMRESLVCICMHCLKSRISDQHRLTG